MSPPSPGPWPRRPRVLLAVLITAAVAAVVVGLGTRSGLLACAAFVDVLVVLLVVRALRPRLAAFFSEKPWRQRAAARRLRALLPDGQELPPLGGWAASADFAWHVASLIAERTPARVLELGSGSSTVLTGLALRAAGRGAVVSLEESAEHADRTRAELARRSLGDVASVLTAPLEPTADGGRWYGEEALAAATAAGPFDLVVVDGPSTIGAPGSRAPALPRLLPSLAPDAVVLLDDTSRAGERAALAEWRTAGLLDEFTEEHLPTAKGAVLLRRNVRAAPSS